MPSPRRLLLLSNQPPGGSGVRAIRYGKLLPHLRALGWELHVLGPDPALDSVFLVPVEAVSGSLHYVRSVAWSRRWSVRRHRLAVGHPLRGVYGVIQGFCLLLERLRRAQPQAAKLQPWPQSGGPAASAHLCRGGRGFT